MKSWEDCWRRVAIGSDFDGAINPVDAYCWSPDFRTLEPHLVERFVTMQGMLEYPLLQGRTKEDIEQIADWFLRKNALDFLEKYFTDEYRK